MIILMDDKHSSLGFAFNIVKYNYMKMKVNQISG